jgi:3-dehydroquinate synthase
LPKRTQNIKVALGDRSYPIQIGSGVRRQFADFFKKHGSGRAFWITDRNVARLWGQDLKPLWKNSPASPIILPAGENQKRLSVIENLCRKLSVAGVERGDTLIALGGGVIGDLVGFTAACYLRGIAFIQIPTTLLAMVDASVGGKTGVDLPEGKNLVGAFHQPRFVLADLDFLSTLPRRELVSGLAEVVKTALISDPALFRLIEKNLDQLAALNPAPMARAIKGCVSFKAAVVAIDEREADLRRILNFGHTIGHALEALGGYNKLRHGEAVFWGMIAAVELSAGLSLLNRDTADRILALLNRFAPKLPVIDFQPAQVLAIISRDKKVRRGAVHFIMLGGIGRPIICDAVDSKSLRTVLVKLRESMTISRRKNR